MNGKTCQVCQKSLTGKQRKYCSEHAEQAQTLYNTWWQRRNRNHPDWTEEQWQEWEEAMRIREASKAFIEIPDARTLFPGDPDRERKLIEWQHKYQRVKQRRLRGKVVCFWCEEVIPEEVLKKRKRPKGDPPRCCDRQCATALQSYLGGYYHLSRYGNRAQQEYKAKNGVVPGYEQRKAALQRPGHNGRAK